MTDGPTYLCIGVGFRDAYASNKNRSGLFLQSRSHFLQEDTAALLAGKGFTTLALAFFGAPGLPRCQPCLFCETEHISSIAGAMPVFCWSTLRQHLICFAATVKEELEWLDSLKEETLHSPWQLPRARVAELGGFSRAAKESLRALGERRFSNFLRRT